MNSWNKIDMARMHPEDIEGLASATEGERKVLRYQKEDFLVWKKSDYFFRPVIHRTGINFSTALNSGSLVTIRPSILLAVATQKASA